MHGDKWPINSSRSRNLYVDTMPKNRGAHNGAGSYIRNAPRAAAQHAPATASLQPPERYRMRRLPPVTTHARLNITLHLLDQYCAHCTHRVISEAQLVVAEVLVRMRGNIIRHARISVGHYQPCILMSGRFRCRNHACTDTINCAAYPYIRVRCVRASKQAVAIS